MNLRHLVVASLAVAALCGGGAFAQSTGTTVQPLGDPVKEDCSEDLAGLMGHLSYLETKLDLTEQQRPLWTAWRDAVVAGQREDQAECLRDTAAGDPNIVDRMDDTAKDLAAKAAHIRAAQAPLVAFYGALTPAQKALLDQ